MSVRSLARSLTPQLVRKWVYSMSEADAVLNHSAHCTVSAAYSPVNFAVSASMGTGLWTEEWPIRWSLGSGRGCASCSTRADADAFWAADETSQSGDTLPQLPFSNAFLWGRGIKTRFLPTVSALLGLRLLFVVVDVD